MSCQYKSPSNRILIRLLLLAVMILPVIGWAQDNEPKPRRVFMRFGINGGAAWQTSDVRTTGGGGTGATLEFPIVENDHSFIGAGLRFRYLFTGTGGRDYVRSFDVLDNDVVNGSVDSYIDYRPQGSYFANHRTSSHNWDLELLLTLNRLRARTGVVAYVWGGLGTMGFRAKVDQEDFFNGLYDYSTITSTNRDDVLSDLAAMQDRDYETLSDPNLRGFGNRWRFAPSVGVGLGYEFTRWFQLVAEYKMTFPMTDGLDGKGNIKTASWNNTDVHHYAGIGVMFGALGGGGGGGNYVTPSDPNNYTPVDNRPTIVLIEPSNPNADLGLDCYGEIRARLTHITNKSQITFFENGMTVNPDRYSYDPSNGMFVAQVVLVPRIANNYRIVARNNDGSASQELSLRCGNPQFQGGPGPCHAPEVFITYPQGCPVVVPSCMATVYAEVHNVKNRSEIQVFHYGRMVPGNAWDFNPSNGQMTIRLPLEPGDNRLEIIARTPCGEDRASNMMTCPTQVVMPTVDITTPSITPYSSQNCVQSVVARVTGVRTSADITVYQNGIMVSPQAWSYNIQTQLLNMTVSMTPGNQTVIEILATSANGQAGDMVTLSCYNQSPPPTVHIISPPGGNYDGQDCNQHVTARLTNVSGLQDITVRRNGTLVPSYSWSYNAYNQIWSMDVQLQPGQVTTLVITVRNTVGSAETQATLRCSEPAVQMITICHIPPGNPGAVTNITIPEEQWPDHKAHGDVRGPCSTTNVTLCYEGQAINVTSSALQAYLAMGATQGPCVTPNVTICHIPPGNPGAAHNITISPNAWPAHQAHGDIQGPCSPKKIDICYEGQTISISETLWPTYQALGATQGPCPPKMMTICHIPPGNPAAVNTLTIPATAWPAHQAHGDVEGACSSKQVTICFKGQTMTISESAWAVFQSQGATQGPCPEPQITICHIPPKNPAGAQTMTIPQSAWNGHQAHGDVQGPCSTQMVTVCYNNQTVQVSQTALQAMLAAGATQGACPAADITICHIPPGNPANPQTITISANAWPAHEAHGDIQGACSGQTMQVCHNGKTITVSVSAWPALQEAGATQGPCAATIANNVTICHIPPGNPANAQTLTIAQSAWPAHQAHGDVQGACSTTMVPVCYNNQTVQVSQSALPAMLAAGATQGACPVQTVKDITICHIPPGNPANPQTITVSPNAWPAHQAHGDVQGPCSNNMVTVCLNNQTVQVSQSALQAVLTAGGTQGACPEPQITICHLPPGNPANAQTLTIAQSAWPAHQAHGDVQGACSSQQVTLCYNSQTIQVSQSAVQAMLAAGATQGACAEPQLTICHIPPGNPANPQTLTISQSAWPAHQAHGDVQGACSGQQITACYNNQTIQVSQSAWPALQQAGATQGACPEPQITICHIPPGNVINEQTITIPQSAWAAHQAHGDHQGPCSSKKITICHIPPGNPGNGQTISISESAWPAHRDRHGDTEGACPTNLGGGNNGGGNNGGGNNGGNNTVKPSGGNEQPAGGKETVKPAGGKETVKPKGEETKPAESGKGTVKPAPTQNGGQSASGKPSQPAVPSTPKAGVKPAAQPGTPVSRPSGGKP